MVDNVWFDVSCYLLVCESYINAIYLITSLAVNFDLESSTASPAVISYTKKPKKKGGFSIKKAFFK